MSALLTGAGTALGWAVVVGMLTLIALVLVAACGEQSAVRERAVDEWHRDLDGDPR